jgi:hypothetical protein
VEEAGMPASGWRVVHAGRYRRRQRWFGADFGNPINTVPIAAGLIAGIGDVTLEITDDFQIAGIALGTLMVIVYFHVVRILRDRFGIIGAVEPEREPSGREAGGESTGMEASGRET